MVIGVTVHGERDILGLWAGDGGEGAKFWLAVLTELRNRGVADVCIAVCDGLKGLPEAITTTWPLATVQACSGEQPERGENELPQPVSGFVAESGHAGVGPHRIGLQLADHRAIEAIETSPKIDPGADEIQDAGQDHHGLPRGHLPGHVEGALQLVDAGLLRPPGEDGGRTSAVRRDPMGPLRNP